MRDVSSLTGHDVQKIKIKTIDYQKKIAVLDICYKE